MEPSRYALDDGSLMMVCRNISWRAERNSFSTEESVSPLLNESIYRRLVTLASWPAL